MLVLAGVMSLAAASCGGGSAAKQSCITYWNHDIKVRDKPNPYGPAPEYDIVNAARSNGGVRVWVTFDKDVAGFDECSVGVPGRHAYSGIFVIDQKSEHFDDRLLPFVDMHRPNGAVSGKIDTHGRLTLD